MITANLLHLNYLLKIIYQKIKKKLKDLRAKLLVSLKTNIHYFIHLWIFLNIIITETKKIKVITKNYMNWLKKI